jgi:uncharacterized iron-regulated protein
MMPWLVAAIFVPFLQPPAPPAQPAPHPPVLSSYVPQRVFDTRRNAFGDFESMLADLTRADAVFLGEQHDDPNTHRLELAVVEGLTRRGVPVVVALEMFERDVQSLVDRYVAGTITEEQFLKESRPWPRYATDYRPVIEFARAHKLPIVASNTPRRIATDVSKTGLAVLDGLGADRALVAKDVSCKPSGSYYDRFVAAMGGHQGTTPNFFYAQCVKDETMGEAVADAFRKATERVTIVHINGAFHSDFGEGAAESARRRLPGRRIAVVSFFPVEDIDGEKPDSDDLTRADYLVFTLTSKQQRP